MYERMRLCRIRSPVILVFIKIFVQIGRCHQFEWYPDERLLVAFGQFERCIYRTLTLTGRVLEHRYFSGRPLSWRSGRRWWRQYRPRYFRFHFVGGFERIAPMAISSLLATDKFLTSGQPVSHQVRNRFGTIPFGGLLGFDLVVHGSLEITSSMSWCWNDRLVGQLTHHD